MPWPCNADEKWIVHFPETREIWSFGSGYGGNALLGKKCFALRIASVIARDEGWLAEHMLVLKITSPEGRVQVHRRGVPVGVRQDQPRDAHPDRARVDGRDHRRRHRVDEVRRRGPAARHQPRVRVLRRRARHQRAAPTRTRCTRWTPTPCSPTPRSPTTATCGGRTSPTSRPRTSPTGRASRGRRSPTAPAAHPNSRFCAPRVAGARRSHPSGRTRRACRSRRSSSAAGAPRPCRSCSSRTRWQHGVLVAATMGSEKTAAATGGLGELRRDPFAMLPFCGYNMGDYFAHWLSMAERTDEASLPAIYGVNWFRKGDDGTFLWPGFGENSRVLEWICRRLDGDAVGCRHRHRRGAPPADLDARRSRRERRRRRRRARGRRRRVEARAARHPRVLRRVRRPHARASSSSSSTRSRHASADQRRRAGWPGAERRNRAAERYARHPVTDAGGSR